MTGKSGGQLRGPIWRASVADEVAEEISFHVEMRARELAETGMSLEEARRISAERFDIGRVRAQCEAIGARREREMKRSAFLSELWQDIGYALRQIRVAPGFALLVIGTLALGIGASTTIFSAVNAVVLRPLGFPNESRVVMVQETWKGEASDASAGSYTDWKTQAGLLDAVAAIDWDSYVIAAGDRPDRVQGAAVTSDYFRVFSTRPVIGRTFSEAESGTGGPRVAVLSWRAYERRFNANPAVVGSDIVLNGEPARVLGVMPEGFDPMQTGEDVWVPLPIGAEQIAARSSHYLDVVGRMKTGVSPGALRQQLEQISAGERRLYPDENEERTIRAVPIREVLLGDYGNRLFLLLSAVLVVLLIACANVANIQLARGATRQKELAVRAALGAGRARILRQLLTENLVLSLVTVALSIGIAALGTRLIAHYAPTDIPRIAETRIDPAVLAFAIVLGTLSSLIFGLAPALRALRIDLQSTLRSGGRDARGPIRDWLRSALVAAEVALSVLLLTGAGLLIRTSIDAGRVAAGFRVDGVVAARVTLPAQAYPDPQRSLAAFTAIVEGVAATPGVKAAASTSLTPLGYGGNEMFLNPEGRPQTRANASVARLRVVSPDYFKAMEIPLVRGRLFNAGDVRSGTLVAIISTDLARKIWPGEDPLGKRFACCEGEAAAPVFKTVVGVAPALHSQGPMVPVDPEFYIPLAQTPPDSWNWLQRTMTIVATGTAGDEALVRGIRDAVYRVDPAVPVYSVTTLQEALRGVLAPARFNTMLLSLLGFLGLVLAAVGIYGVVSYFVNLRTKEIGVRIALGATTASVLRLMTRQALGPVAIGLLLGALSAVAATRLLTASLFDVTPTDPLTFLLVITVLLAVALAAIVIPAARAARIPPSQALIG